MRRPLLLFGLLRPRSHRSAAPDLVVRGCPSPKSTYKISTAWEGVVIVRDSRNGLAVAILLRGRSRYADFDDSSPLRRRGAEQIEWSHRCGRFGRLTAARPQWTLCGIGATLSMARPSEGTLCGRFGVVGITAPGNLVPQVPPSERRRARFLSGVDCAGKVGRIAGRVIFVATIFRPGGKIKKDRYGRKRAAGPDDRDYRGVRRDG